MNGLNSHQEALKMRWNEKGGTYKNSSPFNSGITGGGVARATPMMPPPSTPTQKKFLGLSSQDDDDVASTVIPPVTIVLEGRSICKSIYLNKHTSYDSFAMALRRMLVDDDGPCENRGDGGLDLSNAVPGFLVAYEDMEDDLLLAGDLCWRDFVRVVKRIRIIPAKTSHQKYHGGAKSD